MDVIAKIKALYESSPDETHLELFLSDVRDSLITSNRQFMNLQLLLLIAVVTYYLVVHAGWEGISYGPIKISDKSLFQKIFLIIPSALFVMQTAVGYLRRLQREVYDYATIARCRIFGELSLHELRLPSNYIQGLDIMQFEAGIIGKMVSRIVSWIMIYVFVLGPAIYMISEATKNLGVFGTSDIISIISSILVVIMCCSGIIIIVLTGRIKA